MSTNDGTVAMQVRVRAPLRTEVEDWRRKQERVPPLSEALRQLLLLTTMSAFSTPSFAPATIDRAANTTVGILQAVASALLAKLHEDPTHLSSCAPRSGACATKPRTSVSTTPSEIRCSGS
jgi:hypothetical protein